MEIFEYCMIGIALVCAYLYVVGGIVPQKETLSNLAPLFGVRI